MKQVSLLVRIKAEPAKCLYAKWWLICFIVLPALGCGSTKLGQPQSDHVTQAQYVAIMQNLSSAWNDGDAKQAADLFTADAVYSEPPAKQLYRGRQALYEFFGGSNGRPGQMSMTWHHLAFDEGSQIGFGEFSFTYGSTAHGVAVVRLNAEKISNWREYWYESELSWREFTRKNRF